MKKITIKYNPYLVQTQIWIDGQKPKGNSSLIIKEGMRLQEWIERLPEILLNEYRESNFHLEFTGSKADYDDIIASIEAVGKKINVRSSLNKTADIADAEEEIDDLFEEIQKGPISQLKEPSITNAFVKAKNSLFEINVIATMSSGKSTLINALLGRKLMPAANEATTATIVKIIDTDQDSICATAYDQSGNKRKFLDNVTIDDMKEMNEDVSISSIIIKCRIPFASKSGMRLVLVDTPGPNNSRDENHKKMTYQMIDDSDKSLVLFVMNGQQLGINDEEIFLNSVCLKMQEGGKQGRERFIFAVNKLDTFNIEDEGEDCIENALLNVKKGLEQKHIDNPNILPVTAQAALELRTKPRRNMALNNFRRDVEEFKELHFEKYYHYSHLPQMARHEVENLLLDAQGDEVVEVNTGIISIEQAINLYINKYARTTKVKDLVLAFNQRMTELETEAKIKKDIAQDKSKKAELDKTIQKIKSNIQSAKNAQALSNRIDCMDLTSPVRKDVRKYLDEVKNQINDLQKKYSGKIEKNIAINKCNELEKNSRDISIQIEVRIEGILKKSYKDTITTIVEEYKKYMSALNMGVNSSVLTFNPLNLVSVSLTNLSDIIKDNTETENESYTEMQEYKVFVKSKRKWFNPFSWFEEGDHYETRTRFVVIDKFVDYVDMREVSEEYLHKFSKHLIKTQNDAEDYISKEAVRLKDHLKGELTKIDKLLTDKLNDLSRTEVDTSFKAEEIAKKEKELQWLMSIQNRVKKIIEF